jgi:AraC-like DNA-binding protein
MQMMRLHGIYQELRTTSSKQSISRLASDWGFNHLGRFSKQYKRMFDKLPSETSKNS